jgi:hypothetical protein
VAICFALVFGFIIFIARSGPSESTQAFVKIARTAGMAQGLTYSNSDGPKSAWCTTRADEFISNGDDELNRFAAAALQPITHSYYRACMGN